MYYNNVEKMKDFIEERLQRGVNTFTHKDILNNTTTNCSYSVLSRLKKYYEISHREITKQSIKKDLKNNEVMINIRFREYIVEKKKEKNKNAKEANIWRTSEIGYTPSIFMGETIS